MIHLNKSIKSANYMKPSPRLESIDVSCKPERGRNSEHLRKPEWLNIKLNTNENYRGLKKLMREQNLNTVCEEARCPNIHECWGERRTATFMILRCNLYTCLPILCGKHRIT